MKSLFAGIMFLSSVAMADEVVFLQENPMPEALRAKVAAQLTKRCSKAFEITNLIIEEKTNVHIERVDNGVVDYYYSSTFSVTLQNDPAHFESQFIYVKSAQFGGTNPTPDDYGVVESIIAGKELCN